MYIVFDIGGTTMRLALSSDGLSLDGQIAKIDTPQDFEEAMTVFTRVVSDLSEGLDITGVAGGIAGVLSSDKKMLLNAPNLSDWINKPMAEKLSQNLGAPVFLENDTALAGLGEAHYGAGQGSQIVAYISIGTGLGGARIVDGRIDEKALGFEPGHQVIDINGLVCPTCQVRGHLESYVSGRVLEEKYGLTAHEIKDVKITEEVSKYLAIGLCNMTVFWSPEVIVLGGGVVQNLEGLVEKTVEHFEKQLNIFKKRPKIILAKYKDEAGLYGALVYLNKKFKS